MDLSVYHKKHWEHRWSAKHLDYWLGGRGIGRANKVAAEIAVLKFKATRVLDIGAGCWRFINYCRELGAEHLAGIDVPIARAVEFRSADAVFTWNPEDISADRWPKGFDVVHQRNALPCMRSSALPRMVGLIARLAPIFISSGSWRCRFWEGPRGFSSPKRVAWLKALVAEKFCLLSTHSVGRGDRVTVWRRRAGV